MSTSFRALVRATLWAAFGGTLAAAAPAWAQKIADGFSGFDVELLYKAPDIEHPSVFTCGPEDNLFVGEDPMDMRGLATKEFDRVVMIRWVKKTGAPLTTVRRPRFCQTARASRLRKR